MRFRISDFCLSLGAVGCVACSDLVKVSVEAPSGSRVAIVFDDGSVQDRGVDEPLFVGGDRPFSWFVLPSDGFRDLAGEALAVDRLEVRFGAPVCRCVGSTAALPFVLGPGAECPMTDLLTGGHFDGERLGEGRLQAQLSVPGTCAGPASFALADRPKEVCGYSPEDQAPHPNAMFAVGANGSVLMAQGSQLLLIQPNGERATAEAPLTLGDRRDIEPVGEAFVFADSVDEGADHRPRLTAVRFIDGRLDLLELELELESVRVFHASTHDDQSAFFAGEGSVGPLSGGIVRCHGGWPPVCVRETTTGCQGAEFRAMGQGGGQMMAVSRDMQLAVRGEDGWACSPLNIPELPEGGVQGVVAHGSTIALCTATQFPVREILVAPYPDALSGAAFTKASSLEAPEGIGCGLVGPDLLLGSGAQIVLGDQGSFRPSSESLGLPIRELLRVTRGPRPHVADARGRILTRDPGQPFRPVYRSEVGDFERPAYPVMFEDGTAWAVSDGSVLEFAAGACRPRKVPSELSHVVFAVKLDEERVEVGTSTGTSIEVRTLDRGFTTLDVRKIEGAPEVAAAERVHPGLILLLGVDGSLWGLRGTVLEPIAGSGFRVIAGQGGFGWAGGIGNLVRVVDAMPPRMEPISSDETQPDWVVGLRALEPDGALVGLGLVRDAFGTPERYQGRIYRPDSDLSRISGLQEPVVTYPFPMRWLGPPDAVEMMIERQVYAREQSGIRHCEIQRSASSGGATLGTCRSNDVFLVR